MNPTKILIILVMISHYTIAGNIRISTFLLTHSTQLDINSTSDDTLPSVKICNQIWMLKNLDVSTYRTGDKIPQVTDSATWASLTTGAWCWYKNDSVTYATKYGRLYNWYAVNDPRGLAPEGWHVPSHKDWSTLFICLGGPNNAAGKMKAISSFRLDRNSFVTNSSGFTGLPGGKRKDDGVFKFNGYIANWWSSTETNSTNAELCILMYDEDIAITNSDIKALGLSVRCVKD